MARQHGLTEERIAESEDFENRPFTPREKAALRFSGQLTVNYRKVDDSIWEPFREHFTPREMSQIAVFSAWQSNGLRVIHSWKAESLWGNDQVALPYSDDTSIFQKFPSNRLDSTAGHTGLERKAGTQVEISRIPDHGGDPGANDPADLLAFPTNWISFLSLSPEAEDGWKNFFRLSFTDGILDLRLKTLVWIHMADILGSEPWVRTARNLAHQVGVRKNDLESLKVFEESSFSLREKSALRYAECITTDYLAVDDEMFGELKRNFSDPELIELGLYIGIMSGTFRLSCSLESSKAWRASPIAKA